MQIRWFEAMPVCFVIAKEKYSTKKAQLKKKQS